MIGSTVLHYQILEKLGEGGMGSVYQATDTRLNRTVALKFLSPDLTRDEEAKKRFIQEAQAASALQHNNICTIHDIAETADGRLFIVMDYYRGETLRERLGEGPLPIDEVTRIIIQIADGLARAHENGIVHRDLKPENIILTGDGTVKILDFGLAKLAGQSTVSRAGSIAGTVAYMSPEQARGERVDHRTDIWSLGVMLYEMFAGEKPFQGEHMAALFYSIQNEEPKDVSRYRKDIPGHFLELLNKCLEKDPAQRLPSMRQVRGIIAPDRAVSGLAPDARTGRRRLHSRFILPLAAITVIAIGIARFGPSFLSFKGRDQWRIGVMPFRDLTGKPEAKEWPSLIQYYVACQLTGIPKLGVIESLGLNNILESSFGGLNLNRNQDLYDILPPPGELTFLIDGEILWSVDRFILRANVRDQRSGEHTYTPKKYFQTQDNLSDAVYQLIQEILNYLEVKKVLTARIDDLAPWIGKHRIPIGAVKEFLQASQLIFRGEKGAGRHHEAALKIDSTFISPRIWMISGLVPEGRMEEAIGHYRVLEKLDTGASHFDRAMIGWAKAFIDHDIPRQIGKLEIALEYSPRNLILQYNLARCHFMLGSYNRAIESLIPAIEMRWPYSTAWCLLSLSYLYQGDRNRAKEIALESLSIQPVYYEIYGLLSIFAGAENDATSAGKWKRLYFQQGEKQGWPVEYLYSNLGLRLLEDAQFGAAVTIVRKGIQEYPNNPDLYFVIARAYSCLTEPDSASHAFEHALKLDSTRIEAHFHLGEIYQSQKEITKAIHHYTAYLGSDSVSTTAKTVKERLNALQQ